jgi:phosphoserine phosphatase
MTKLKFLLLTLLTLVVVNQAQAEIVEAKNMGTVSHLITKGSLVVFDLDNTLIQPAQSLGGDAWFHYTFKTLVDNGMPTEDALKKTITLWQQVNVVTKVLPVQTNTPLFIHQLQEANVRIIALTSRSADFAIETEKQLAQVRIDFSRNSVGELGDLRISPGVRYRRGVISSSGQDKGSVLVQFLHHYNYSPSKIVFVDDQLRNVQSVDKALANLIPNYSVRYSFLDEEVSHFDSRITDLEGTLFWGHGLLISDERAEALLKSPRGGQLEAQEGN